LAADGLAVFPCIARTKQPATRRGFYDATTNPATIRRWFAGGQEYNLAVRTGMASGIWVLDVDDETSLDELTAKHGPIPTTRQSQSSRGRHFWFRCDSPIQSSASRVAPGIDVKGDGGYIMAPPSIHESGIVYQWLSNEPITCAPDWLVNLTRAR